MKPALMISCILAAIVQCKSMCSNLDSFETATVLLDQNTIIFNQHTISRENIGTYLERCLFLGMTSLNTRLLCRQGCTVTDTCLVYFLSLDGVCELCVTKLARSFEVEHALADVYVDLTKLSVIKGEKYVICIYNV